jgi:hypothetical protein
MISPVFGEGASGSMCSSIKQDARKGIAIVIWEHWGISSHDLLMESVSL